MRTNNGDSTKAAPFEMELNEARRIVADPSQSLAAHMAASIAICESSAATLYDLVACLSSKDHTMFWLSTTLLHEHTSVPKRFDQNGFIVIDTDYWRSYVFALPDAGRKTLVRRRPKVLFVCAINKQRSATAERVYHDDKRFAVRSAGVQSGAVRRVCEDDLLWANVVFVMEDDHKLWIEMRFEGMKLPPIKVLHIPDVFEYMDVELIEALRAKLEPELEAFLKIE